MQQHQTSAEERRRSDNKDKQGEELILFKIDTDENYPHCHSGILWQTRFTITNFAWNVFNNQYYSSIRKGCRMGNVDLEADLR